MVYRNIKKVAIIILVVIIFPLIANAYLWTKKHWNNDQLNPVMFNILSIPDGCNKKSIKNAAVTWSNVNANFAFKFNNKEALNYVQAVHLIDPQVIAETWLDTSLTDGNIIIRAITRYNLDCSYYFSSEGETGKIDIESNMLHEFGHWLELDDVRDSVSAVMYYSISTGTIKRDLTQDDINGIKYIYPFSAWVSCTTNTATDPFPFYFLIYSSYTIDVVNGGLWEWIGRLYDTPELYDVYHGIMDSHPWWGISDQDPIAPLSKGYLQISIDDSVVYTVAGQYYYIYTWYHYNTVRIPEIHLTKTMLESIHYPGEYKIKWVVPTWPYEITSGDSTLALEESPDCHFHTYTSLYQPLNAFCRTTLIPYNPSAITSQSSFDYNIATESDVNTIMEKSEIFIYSYPNPFSKRTEISYVITNTAIAKKVSLNIYNVLGQKVRTLINENQQPGKHSIVWDRKTDKGDLAGNGIYVCRLQAGENTDTKKIMIIK